MPSELGWWLVRRDTKATQLLEGLKVHFADTKSTRPRA